jgi:hypothetical protein
MLMFLRIYQIESVRAAPVVRHPLRYLELQVYLLGRDRAGLQGRPGLYRQETREELG